MRISQSESVGGRQGLFWWKWKGRISLHSGLWLQTESNGKRGSIQILISAKLFFNNLLLSLFCVEILISPLCWYMVICLIHLQHGLLTILGKLFLSVLLLYQAILYCSDKTNITVQLTVNPQFSQLAISIKSSTVMNLIGKQ